MGEVFVSGVLALPLPLTAVAQAVVADADGNPIALRGVFDPRMYGAVCDGSTDDTAAAQSCADDAETAGGCFHLPAGLNLKITSQLDLRYCGEVRVEGKITVAHTSGTGVLVGDSSAQTRCRPILINEVVYGGAQSNVAVRVVGIKNGKVTINLCPYVQLYADVADATMSSIAYSEFWFGKIDKHEIYGETGVSWINENRFYGGRLATILVDSAVGGYSHNHNKWFNANLESANITFNVGTSNLIDGARFEGTCAVTFGATTWKNRVIQTWYSNQSSISPNPTVTDAGFDNHVLTNIQADATLVTILRIDSASRTTDVASEWNSPHATRRITPGFRKLAVPNAFTDYWDSGLFSLDGINPTPANGGAWLRNLWWHSDAALWRPRVYVYDSNRAALDGTSTDYMMLTGGWAWNASGFYTFSTNVDGGRIRFYHPDVKYARIVFHGYATGSFEYIELTGLVQAPHGTQLADFISRQSRRPLASDSAPTKSLLRLGDHINMTTGIRLVIARVDTTLSVAAVSTDTTITVASATGISSGDNIAVLLDDGTTHFTTVNGAPSGSVVTLTAAMPGAAAIGNDVATQRFLTVS